jgi:hypothetical protein
MLRRTEFAACLLVLLAFTALAAAESSPPPAKADLDQLLGGVSKIAISGTPGSMCLFAPQAFPLVAASHDKRSAAVVAATRLGKGRAVEFAHNGYLGRATLDKDDTGRLFLNAVQWAGAAGEKTDKTLRVGARRAGDALKFLTDKQVPAVSLDGKDWLKQLNDCGVLVVEAGGFAPGEELAAVNAFVENGGGLVVAGCPWGWAQVTGRNLRTQYPPNLLLGPAGMVAADTYVGPTADGGFSVANPPDTLMHAGVALDMLVAQSKGGPAPSKKDLSQASATLMLAVRSVVPEDTLLLPRIRELVKDLGDSAVPLPSKPLKESSGLARVLVALQDMELRSLPPEKITAHPAAKGFPYEVPADAKRVTRKLDIDTAVPDWHSTGLYAAPGELIEVTLPETAAGKGLGVRIGAHTDHIWHHDSWARWPAISWHAPLKTPVTRIANPFGGAIYIEVPQHCKLGTLAVQVANAVEAPYYVLGKTDLKEWRDTIRNFPAPWAELECRGIVLTVPSKVVRTLDDPEELMKFWNKVVLAEDELAAWKPEDRKRPERMVCDQDISAGYMHSGYPIMTFLDVIETNVNVKKITTVGEMGWGQWHELGHNHQSGDWTPSNCGEVTVNLFSLYVLTQVHGLPLDKTRPGELAEKRRVAKLKAYLASDKTSATWDPFTGLVLYYQLIDGFGWDTLKKVLAEYRGLPGNERPRSDPQKWDQWMVRYSKAAGKNLGPFFQKWKTPVTQTALDSIKDLPAWMHADWTALDAKPPDVIKEK